MPKYLYIILSLLIICFLGLSVSFRPTVPVYPDAKLVSSAFKDTQSILYRAKWITVEPVPQVMNWYLGALIRAHWQLDIRPSNPRSDNIQYAEFIRGNPQTPLSKIQLSVTQNRNRHLTQIEIAFPSPDTEIEE